MITTRSWADLSTEFQQKRYIVIDNFWSSEVANALSQEFPDFNSNVWNAVYNNLIENKRACNAWDRFPAATYSVFYFLNSDKFKSIIKELTGFDVYSDPGLHGAGWHAHNAGGFLNLHRDYHIHPKLKLKRQLNLIVYITPNWDTSWGGALELYSEDKSTLVQRIDCLFNRAVIFDTTAPFWHGLPEAITCPENTSRNSLAVYFLTDPSNEDINGRRRALFTASSNQEGDPAVEELIRKRSDENLSTLVYVTK